MATPGSRDHATTPKPGVVGRGSAFRVPATLSPGRLPTIRSRDLTLGGVKKKTFTPNIISRKSKEELKVDVGPRRDRQDTNRGRNRDGRGRGRGRPEVIQSHSIFEQGPAEMMAKRRGVYDDDRDTSSSAPCAIINIKKEKRETEEETKEILRKLERDNFLDDPHLKNEARSCPVQLPLAVSGWVFKEEFEDDSSLRSIKTEKVTPEDELMNTESSTTVKEELSDAPVMKKSAPMFRPPSLPEPESLPDLLQTWNHCKEDELLFIQLPDSLPGQPPTSDARPTKTAVQSEDGQNMIQKTDSQQEEAEGDNTCSLKELQEGLVGRMLVRKSGRVQLILGTIMLDVALGTPCSFLQELVSVGSEGRRGDMTVLGHIKHKLVCSPDFEHLLENRN